MTLRGHPWAKQNLHESMRLLTKPNLFYDHRGHYRANQNLHITMTGGDSLQKIFLCHETHTNETQHTLVLVMKNQKNFFFHLTHL